MKPTLAVLGTILALGSSVGSAAYTRASSSAVEIDTIYSNEWGSPFVTFKTVVNAACWGGTGMYLYNQEISPGNTQLRNNKMAILLAAKMANKKVVLDYYYDPSFNGWSNCYIHGIQIVDQ
jgi:hypothetical protein